MSSRPVNRSLEERASFYVPALDGLRAISFAVVFLSHGGLSAYVPAGAGVSCFFFLSGFLITTLLEKEWRRSGAISILSFYQRRALPILPPMYLVYSLCLTITGLIPKPSAGLTGGAVLAQLAYATNYYLVPAGNEEHVPLGTQVLWSRWRLPYRLPSLCWFTLLSIFPWPKCGGGCIRPQFRCDWKESLSSKTCTDRHG
jgi:peptidoglycan/LPS O-acetylase OafA/YrhL